MDRATSRPFPRKHIIRTMMTDATTRQQFSSLLAIRAKKTELRKQISEQEKEIKVLWNGLFHQEKSRMPQTPTQRLMSMASTSMSLIDGAIFGWKLYKRFRK